jgi:hypothetical protein
MIFFKNVDDVKPHQRHREEKLKRFFCARFYLTGGVSCVHCSCDDVACAIVVVLVNKKRAESVGYVPQKR